MIDIIYQPSPVKLSFSPQKSIIFGMEARSAGSHATFIDMSVNGSTYWHHWQTFVSDTVRQVSTPTLRKSSQSIVDMLMLPIIQIAHTGAPRRRVSSYPGAGADLRQDQHPPPPPLRTDSNADYRGGLHSDGSRRTMSYVDGVQTNYYFNSTNFYSGVGSPRDFASVWRPFLGSTRCLSDWFLLVCRFIRQRLLYTLFGFSCPLCWALSLSSLLYGFSIGNHDTVDFFGLQDILLPYSQRISVVYVTGFGRLI